MDIKTSKEKDDLIDDTCDLDPDKICDNCGKCIEENVNYKIIKITGFKEEE